MKIRKHLLSTLESDLFIPMLLLLTYLVFITLVRGSIPTAEELINTFAILYAKYGYEIILVAAFLESLVIVNFFVPGQIAMALGIIFARTGHTDLTLVVLTACLGVVLGYTVDYALGYFGFSSFVKKLGYKDLLNHTKNSIKKYETKGLMLSFVNSNIGAFASLGAGVAEYPFIKFFITAVIATLFWASIWGVVVYTFGDIFLELFKRYSFLIFVIFLGGMFFINRFKRS